MKPEYIGIGNFDENNYVYGHCRCPLSVDYAIKWPRIKDGKPHRYSCVCEDCGTEVAVWSKSYGPEILKEQANNRNCYFCKHYKNGYCEELDLKPCYTQEGCDYFSKRMKKFEEIVVDYPPAELCTYPEYRGKPYFSIKYEENGEHIVGFGTYKPEVLSKYLREYFIATEGEEKEEK